MIEFDYNNHTIECQGIRASTRLRIQSLVLEAQFLELGTLIFVLVTPQVLFEGTGNDRKQTKN